MPTFTPHSSNFTIPDFSPADAGGVLFFSGRDLGSRLIQLVTLQWWVYAIAAAIFAVGFYEWNAWSLRQAIGAAITWLSMCFLLSPRISHVAIVAWDEKLGRPLLFESTTDDTRLCALSKKWISGVQAHHPVDRIRDYRGKVYWAPLTEHDRLADEEAGVCRRDTRQALWRELRVQIGIPYTLLGAAVSGSKFVRLFWAPRGHGYAFCSRLVAHALKRVLRLPASIDSCTCHPNGLYLAVQAAEYHEVARRVK